VVAGSGTPYRVAGMFHPTTHGCVSHHRCARGRKDGYHDLYMDDREVAFVGSAATDIVALPSESQHGCVCTCKRGWVAHQRPRRIATDSDISVHTLIWKLSECGFGEEPRSVRRTWALGRQSYFLVQVVMTACVTCTTSPRGNIRSV
jgi:hypothetical protein